MRDEWWLSTARLRLTPLSERDFDEFAALRADSRTRRYTSTGLPASVENSQAELAASQASWEQRGFGTWAVRDPSGRFVGVIEVVPDGLDQGAPDIGWIIDADHWGQGLASEAAEAVVADLFGRVRCPSVTAYLRRGNHGSRRVAEKLGMVLRGAGTAQNGDEIELYELIQDAHAKRCESRHDSGGPSTPTRSPSRGDGCPDRSMLAGRSAFHREPPGKPKRST